MQIVFDDGAGRWELDVRVNKPSATVADLAAALDPGGEAGSVLIDDRRVDPDLELRDAGLHEGAVIRLDDSDAGPTIGTAQRTIPPSLELAVVNGLDAGRRCPLAPGTAVVGRASDCDVVLHHDTVSKRHATVRTAGDGTVTLTDLGSHNGTWIGGEAVVEPVAVTEGTTVRLGALDLEVRRPRGRDRPVALDPWRDVTAAGTIPFNRPPRTAPPSPLAEVRLPQPPRTGSGKGSLSIVSIVAPLVFAGVMFAALRSPHYLLFAGLSPIMAIGNAIDSRRRGRKSERGEKERFRRELAELRQRLDERAAEERARRAAGYPDPAEILRRVTLPSTTLWERRPEHLDFLQLRAGVGDVLWEPPVAGRPGGHGGHGAPAVRATPPGGRGTGSGSGSGSGPLPDEEVTAAVDEASTLRDAAVPVDLAGGGVLGIVGDRTAALALARSLVCQAAVLHGPADLPTMVLAGPDTGPAWDWAKWLPHTRGPSGVDRVLSQDRDLSTRLVEARLEAARASAAQDRSGRPGRPGLPPPGASLASGERRTPVGPTLLVVVDDESLTTGRYAPTRNLLRGDAGLVAGIVIARSADRLPALCTAVVEMDGPDGRADLTLPRQGQQVEGFLACGVGDDTARECARTLACYEDPELDLVGAGLPAAIRLLPLLDLDDCTPEAIRSRWKRAAHSPNRVAAPIGVAESGVLPVDLVADGPHGLVGGTTGSGKSELLRTLVAGLAATLDPDHLTFVLIDFKGGSAFDECARLPHTVGLVTDLDEHLAERALRCLEAELKHRERLLRQVGAIDLPDYLRSSRTTEPLPRLVVVIDEFATLKAELPQFIDALVGVAQRGRSLGVHLLLATQRPQGAISENIKANTNLRIALRVQDRSDSADIIEAPDAAAIPRTAPGRAYVRLGPGEVVAIQTALATGERSDQALAPVDLAPFVYGPLPRAPEPRFPDPERRAIEPGRASAPAAAPAPASASEVRDGEPAWATGSGRAEARDAGGEGPRGTDLSLLVGAIDEAFTATGRPRPRRPWPDPLPGEIDLDVVIGQAEEMAAAATASAAPGAGTVLATPPALRPGPDPSGAASGSDPAPPAAAVPAAGRGRLRFVPLAMADDPDAQTRYPTGWIPRDGNLVVYGIGGSGTTTTLASLALSLARTHDADDLHLYALDLGARELEALAPLPHVGAVITAGERERQTRLIRFLRDELSRRRQMGLAAVEQQPMIVTLIDGWSALAAEYNDVAGGPVTEALHRVFADGPEVRIYTIVAADRPTALPGSLASLVRQRLALRLSEPTAYTSFGIRSTAVPEMVPGRALIGGTGQVVQVARPAAGVAAAAAAIAARTPRSPARPPRPPRPVETLRTDVRLRQLGEGARAQLGPRPWSIPIALTEEALAPASLVAYHGEHALIAGPARSGKTTALLTVAAACRQGRPDVRILAVAGPRSALAHHPLVDEVVAPTAIGDTLRARIEGADTTGDTDPATSGPTGASAGPGAAAGSAASGAPPTLLLVDDAETVDDAGELLTRLCRSDRPDLLVVAAGRNDSVRSGYTHWTRHLRRSKLGVLLVPDADYDGDILGTTVLRRPPVAMAPGRGYLVNSGRSELVQLALPD